MSTNNTRRRLDWLVVERGLAPTRSKAKGLIMAGEVLVDGERMDKAGTLVAEASSLSLKGGGDRWVSRGAQKLLKGLRAFDLSVEGETCLDVGASTGGFTEVLLHYGAVRVFAVDVGYGQLAWSLRNDPRVEVRERTNARYLHAHSFAVRPAFASVDVSFISLRSILPAVASVLAEGGRVVALVKPQFEAGPARLGKGGVVRERRVHAEVLREMVEFIEHQLPFVLRGVSYSPITGPKGNIEFLLYLQTGHDAAGGSTSPSQWLKRVEEVVEQAHRQMAVS
ncbi:MAG: TlyA family RNA methyltransferase [Synergistales bacterium]|nr:TlyA family RNA methyltransferase [Synergistales bacterium]